jgi:hypothetical protein
LLESFVAESIAPRWGRKQEKKGLILVKLGSFQSSDSIELSPNRVPD